MARYWITCLTVALIGGLAGGQEIEQRLEAAVRHFEDGRAEEGDAALKALLPELEAAVRRVGDARSQANLGKALLYLGDDRRAMQVIERALALEPKDPEIRLLRAAALAYGEKPAESLKEVIAARDLAPGVAKYWFELGKAQAGANQIEEALASFRKTVELDPKHARAVLMIGALLAQSGKEDDAFAHFKKAAEIEPTYALAHYHIGQVHQNRGRHTEALAAFQAADKARPEDTRTLAKIVQCHQALGQAKERDEVRGQVIALLKAGRIRDPAFCREQFEVGKAKVLAFEHAELKGPRALRYVFVVQEGQRQYRVSLGSYEMTTQIARETGRIAADQRVFHLDGYYANNEHRTFGLFDQEPTYEETRQMIVEIVGGRREAGGASRPAR
jgi:tetratricopeptide (TPR) repeat protein